MGALYGTVAFIWIVIGCIFAGAVHDYLTGMISIRNRGTYLPGTFMLVMVITYILNAQIGFGLPMTISWIGGFIGAAVLVAIFFHAAQKARANKLPLEEDISNWNKGA